MSRPRAFFTCLIYAALFSTAAYFLLGSTRSGTVQMRQYRAAPACSGPVSFDTYGKRPWWTYGSPSQAAAQRLLGQSGAANPDCRGEADGTVTGIVNVDAPREPGSLSIDHRELQVTLADGAQQTAYFGGSHARSFLDSLHSGDKLRVEIWQGHTTRVQATGRALPTLDNPTTTRNHNRRDLLIVGLLAAGFMALAIRVVVRAVLGRPT